VTTFDTDPFRASCHDAVGGAPEVLGPWQLNLLVGLGLQRDASLLDLGCGTLRGGLHFIRYLEHGRYHGADVAPDLLESGARLVSLAALEEKQPNIMSVAALDARSLLVDWVLTQSVLNHLDENGVLTTVQRAARALRPGGRWVSTVIFDTGVERVCPGAAHGRRTGEFWRSLTNPEWLKEVLDDSGLSMIILPEAAHPRGQDVFLATRLPSGSDRISSPTETERCGS
jgi:SAM-dependent methyltransferase